MTANVQSQEQTQAQVQKPNDKEINFRQLEAKYEKQLAQERAARMEAERVAQELQSRKVESNDDEDDSEPYVDKRKLNKTLKKFGEETKQQTKSEIDKAVQTAIYQERKENWLRNNPDFSDVLQHAEKLAETDPDLADSILEMPEGFERQKLVYKNIKALGLHKEKPKQPSIQEKIDANRRSPYYQPSGVSPGPYAGAHSDFSQKGQKEAYDKMQELKKQLRI